MTDYFKVAWHHQIPEEPTVLYSEVTDGWEVRKVEAYRDGRMDVASGSLQTGTTFLSETPFPAIEEIGRDPQFTPESISRDEFEVVWRQAVGAQGAGDGLS